MYNVSQKQAKKLSRQIQKAKTAQKQYKAKKQVTRRSTQSRKQDRAKRSGGNGRKNLQRRGTHIRGRDEPRNQFTGFNRNHRSILNMRKSHNRLKSMGSSGVPIVRQWSENGEMDIEHGSFESHENHTGTRVSGTEFLGTIDVIAASPTAVNHTQTGEVLFNLPLSPALMPSTRIKQLSELFQVYAPQLYAIHFIPVVPATQNGSVIAGITFDPDYSMAVIPPGDRGMRVWLSMEGFEMVNVYQPFTVIWCPTVQDGYWTRVVDSDARLTVPGNLVVTSASTFSPFDGIETQLPLFNVMLSYEIDFERRGLQIPESIGENTEIDVYAPNTLSSFFFLPTGLTELGKVVCGNILFGGLSNYDDNPETIFLCISKASTHDPGVDSWSSATGPISFLASDTGQFIMSAGRAFYMFLDSGATELCWGFASNLTAAMEKRSNIYWGESGLANADLIDLVFTFRPININ